MGSSLSGLTSSRGDAASSQQRNSATRKRPSRDAIVDRVNKLVSEGQLAPRHPTESQPETLPHECPICFLEFAHINNTKCCKATICTDCFTELLVKDEAVPCPFCTEALKIIFTGNVGGHQSSSSSIHSKPPSGPLSLSSTPDNGTKMVVLASIDARRELEEEMQSHRLQAGDMEDISVVERRMRSQSQQAYRRSHMSMSGAGRRNYSMGNAAMDRNHPTMHSSSRRHLDSSSDEDDLPPQRQPHREPLPYLRTSRSQGSSRNVERNRVPQSTPPREEWLALHDILVNARHGEIGMDSSSLAMLEARMMAQALRLSLLDSGASESAAESSSASTAESTAVAAPPPALPPAEDRPSSNSDLRVSDVSLNDGNDDIADEEMLQLALAMSLVESGNGAGEDASSSNGEERSSNNSSSTNNVSEIS